MSYQLSVCIEELDEDGEPKADFTDSITIGVTVETFDQARYIMEYLEAKGSLMAYGMAGT